MHPRPRLSGPTASVTLTVCLMPEGGISHYEMIGQTIEGAQTYFRAQGSRHIFAADPDFVEMVAHLTALVTAASSDLVNVYGIQTTIEEAPTDR